MFENQIMDASITGIAYIWNAVDPASRALLPIVESFEEKYAGKVKVTKVDIYKSEGIANRLNVKTAPCIVAIKDGKLAGVLSENITEESIKVLAGV
ncbi:MAG: thioredoxin domain-containing protein [Angelakisella sp.]